MLFKKLFLHSFLYCTIVICCKETANTDVSEYCNNFRINRKLLLVSTLDGRLSALSIDNGGAQKWSVSTEPGPLLSSTIHNMELSMNNQFIRIIPSLSGGLYKFDGQSIEPMPVNTDTLLTSYWDDVDISGGKEIRSYAVNIESGDVVYECSMNDCSNWTENTYLNNDILLLRRETQKVRVIELQTRQERWNYSVGLHNVTISQNGVSECNENGASHNFIIKAVVPKGLVYLVYKAKQNKTEWEHQFTSPIVNIWTLVGSRLQWIDLFKSVESVIKKRNVYPTLYIGIHNEQLYIQESESSNRNSQHLGKQRLFMKKYHLIHAYDLENKLNDVPLITDKSESNTSTSLAMLYDGVEFVKGQGYYLYCDEPKDDCRSRRNRLGMLSTVFLSIYYWKEAIILLTITFLLIHFLIPCPNITVLCLGEIVKTICYKLFRTNILIKAEVEASANRQQANVEHGFCRSSSISETGSYRSRYLEDFEPIHCLGKGGFGVVFQARHKVDDCHYAIKRITLPNKEEARERVMREVKALAKLEHQFIVRYFQAWHECPPSGWQEEQDKLWKHKTKEEFLSSEPGGMWQSMTSSVSHIHHRDNSKPNGYRPLPQTKLEKSDSSFIKFENLNPLGSGKSIDEISDEIHTKSFKTVSKIPHKTDNSRKKSNRIVKSSKMYLYIQMQLCQKNSLREWLCDNLKRNQNVVLCMFDQIVQAVEYVHLQGLIHRDLKPSNIFFSPDGQIKVGDFGLVTEIVEDNDVINEPKMNPIFDEHRTANVGTELYMSPEQILGKTYNYKVDIYSLGIILFELLTPFSTQMERYCTLTNLRNNKFPGDFQTNHQDEYNLLSIMLSSLPENRPTTFGIRSRPPLNKLHVSDNNIPAEWHFELPCKNSSNGKFRKSSSESI